MFKKIFLYSLLVLGTALAGAESKPKLYGYCSAGDVLWITNVEPIDNPEAMDAMLTWMTKTYGISRFYWRAIHELTTFRVDGFIPESLDWHKYLVDLKKLYDVDKTFVQLAHKHGMQAIMYLGLYEHGLSPESTSDYFFEDYLRIKYPQYCDIDRFGERRAPGMFSLAYPEARKLLIDSYIKEMEHCGYDGVSFYTYVENTGTRFEHEFGFEQPVVDRFNEKYPDVDLRAGNLTPEQADYWYECRGHFTTQFLRELRKELQPRNKRIGMIMGAQELDLCQIWGDSPIRGTGKIKMDYRTWIKERLVDELWVNLGTVEEQQKALDVLIPLCRGTGIELTVRAVNPLDPVWDAYRKNGVTTVAAISWARNGIESYTGKVETPQGLNSRRWMVRAQALRDIASGKITAPAAQVAKMANDPHLLVRRNACNAMATLIKAGNTELFPVLEKLLFDRNRSVRIGAVTALGKVNRPESVDALFRAVENDPSFQVQFNSVMAIGAAGAAGNAQEIANKAYAALKSEHPAVRKSAIHALYRMIKLKADISADEMFSAIYPFMVNESEVFEVRTRAMEQVLSIRHLLTPENFAKSVDLLCQMIESEPNLRLQLKAAYCIQNYATGITDQARRNRCLTALKNMFVQYGDASTRPDMAWGWRHVGNSLRAFGNPGKAFLHQKLKETNDKFLAYWAYQVLYEVQDKPRKTKGFSLIDEATAIENHKKYAPEFPGWRAEW